MAVLSAGIEKRTVRMHEEKTMPGCGTRIYRDISKTRIDKLLTETISQGGVITGSNPWYIETRLHGIILQGTWYEAEMTLSIRVAAANWYVPCEMVWNNIDTMLHGFLQQEKKMEGALDFG
jgi:hypothetical protein